MIGTYVLGTVKHRVLLLLRVLGSAAPDRAIGRHHGQLFHQPPDHFAVVTIGIVAHALRQIRICVACAISRLPASALVSSSPKYAIMLAGTGLFGNRTVRTFRPQRLIELPNSRAM